MSGVSVSARVGVGDRIEAARVERMAARDAADAEPAAAQGAEAFHCLHRIGRTAGIEPAALPQQRAYQQLVAAEEEQDESFWHLRGRAMRTKVAAREGLGYNTPPLSLKEREELP